LIITDDGNFIFGHGINKALRVWSGSFTRIQRRAGLPIISPDGDPAKCARVSSDVVVSLEWYNLNGCKSALGEAFDELQRVAESVQPVTHEAVVHSFQKAG
jgi:hypothetical protein